MQLLTCPYAPLSTQQASGIVHNIREMMKYAEDMELETIAVTCNPIHAGEVARQMGNVLPYLLFFASELQQTGCSQCMYM